MMVPIGISPNSKYKLSMQLEVGAANILLRSKISNFSNSQISDFFSAYQTSALVKMPFTNLASLRILAMSKYLWPKLIVFKMCMISDTMPKPLLTLAFIFEVFFPSALTMSPKIRSF